MLGLAPRKVIKFDRSKVESLWELTEQARQQLIRSAITNQTEAPPQGRGLLRSGGVVDTGFELLAKFQPLEGQIFEIREP